MKRKTLAWLVVMVCFATLFVWMFAYSSMQRGRQAVGHLNIRIERDGPLYMQEQDVRDWLKQHGLRLEGRSFDELNVSNIEQILQQNPYVAEAQVYPVGDSVLNVDMRQRNPVLKVYNAQQVVFQIDEAGVEMPVNSKYAVRLRVLTGFLPFAPEYGLNVCEMADTSEQAVLKQAFLLNDFLREDPFWDAMFEQIYLTENREFELVPKVGGQVVRLGHWEDKEDLRGKMERLRLFYLYGMGDQGWEKYSVLDLRYEGQLVATKRRGF